MDNILDLQKLIMADNLAPPKSKNSNERHAYFKRPGRGHNRDTCDACGDTGTILCCDNCPASLHWDCNDPPLEEDDLPATWTCHQCAYDKKKALEREAGDDSEDEEPQGSLPTSSLLKRFMEMTEACSRMNPSQFRLPTSYPCYERQFPGAVKAPWKKAKPKPIQAEIENPKTLKVTTFCCVCDKSSRVGAIIKCDFCPFHYHLHCLDPPLTVVPSSIVWACPMHPEVYLESKLLRSSALSERIKIWDETGKSFDPAIVELKFVKKINMLKRRGIEDTRPTNLSIKIPRMVKATYPHRCILSQSSSEFSEWPPSEQVTSNVPSVSSVPNGFGEIKYDFPFPGTIALESPTSTQSSGLDGTGSPGLSLLANAVNLRSQTKMLDEYLKGIHPDMIKALAVQKLLETREQEKPQFLTIDHIEDMKEAVVEIAADSNPTPDMIIMPPANTHTKVVVPFFTLISLNKGLKITIRNVFECEIGTGPQASLNLSKYGRCSDVSEKHAKIYYDKISSSWELMNYSPNGTFVNNELFGCTSYRAEPIQAVKQAVTLDDFKEIINKRRNIVITSSKKPKTLSTNTSSNTNQEIICPCSNPKTKKQPENVHEGGVSLQKGDILQFGCRQFVIASMGYTES